MNETGKVALRRVRTTIVVVEKQSVCLYVLSRRYPERHSDAPQT